jgi:hypothetical protein
MLSRIKWIAGNSIGHIYKLLGILYAGPVQPQSGNIVVEPS